MSREIKITRCIRLHTTTHTYTYIICTETHTRSTSLTINNKPNTNYVVLQKQRLKKTGSIFTIRHSTKRQHVFTGGRILLGMWTNTINDSGIIASGERGQRNMCIGCITSAYSIHWTVAHVSRDTSVLPPRKRALGHLV